jgi:hypothetical protein
MFSFGIGIERGDITMNAHTQIGYVSATIKNMTKQMIIIQRLVRLCLICCLLIPITVSSNIQAVRSGFLGWRKGGGGAEEGRRRRGGGRAEEGRRSVVE